LGLEYKRLSSKQNHLVELPPCLQVGRIYDNFPNFGLEKERATAEHSLEPVLMEDVAHGGRLEWSDALNNGCGAASVKMHSQT
jgi:hypothetical protein